MLHTIEIGRRPVAIINASRHTAEEWSSSQAFKQDLTVLRDAGGSPVWNGEGQPVVRAARDEEIAKWDAARTAGNADEEDKAGYFTFLVPVKNPTFRASEGSDGRADNKLRPVRA